jgi:hypothetical protein
MLVKNDHVMSENREFEPAERWGNTICIDFLLNDAKRKNEERVARIDRCNAVISTFIDVDNVIAVF